MPFLQRVLGRLNNAFSEEGIGALREHRRLFSEGNDLLQAIYLVGRRLSSPEVAYLSAAPSGMKEAIRAVIHENLGRDEPLPITWAWRPDYDWQLTIWECPGTEGSRGAFTILIGSRYPGDRHPGGEKTS